MRSTERGHLQASIPVSIITLFLFLDRFASRKLKVGKFSELTSLARFGKRDSKAFLETAACLVAQESLTETPQQQNPTE